MLLDNQRFSLRVAFQPGAPGGPEYPPLGAFSRDNPAYYPVRDPVRPLRLTVSTQVQNAALVLRAMSLLPISGPALPTDRVEYSVNGGPWQRVGTVQAIALVPASGQATYDIALRLRLEGDETAGERQLVLIMMIEPQPPQSLSSLSARTW
ncbi:hypothetical protein [Deinococcus aerolatus]|uniref:hypothetical protein n=1 Tax=Deinococcus aerolatus TaxID=522487 RepID=UPI00166DB303|nr:hypothetical protein [Deinococcus aerolatus]